MKANQRQRLHKFPNSPSNYMNETATHLQSNRGKRSLTSSHLTTPHFRKISKYNLKQNSNSYEPYYVRITFVAMIKSLKNCSIKAYLYRVLQNILIHIPVIIIHSTTSGRKEIKKIKRYYVRKKSSGKKSDIGLRE